jgi:hypothetical protein
MFSLGEIANFSMMGVMILTLLYTRRRHTEEDMVGIRKSLNDHLIDCAKKNGEVETTLKQIEGDIRRLTRSVDNVSAQIRNSTLGVSDRFIHSLPEGET